MFEKIEAYLERSREERRKHLHLDQSCIEIGGYSKEFRGMLAHFLKTTIPRGKYIHLCHACNNEKCSNINHLYWGSAKDNHQDQVERGTHSSFADRLRAKYSEEELIEIRSRSGRKRGLKSRERWLSVPHGPEFLEAAAKVNEIGSYLEWKRGWKARAAEALGISHTHVSRLKAFIDSNV